MRGPAHRRALATQRLRTQGLTLVEVAIGVCLIGLVLAVFIPTFLRELRTSKTAEASRELQALHDLTAAYYRRSFRDQDGNRITRCLPGPAGPTPEKASAAPLDIDFASEGIEGAATWQALGYQPGSIRFRYSFLPQKDGCDLRGSDEGTPLVTFRAEGDLDGDGKHSLFERSATPDEDGVLQPVDILHVLDRGE
ncbi:MAG: hypothetical protein AAGF12_12345 [Myxococcota bacterium]